jgi:hypothetical protein
MKLNNSLFIISYVMEILLLLFLKVTDTTPLTKSEFVVSTQLIFIGLDTNTTDLPIHSLTNNSEPQISISCIEVFAIPSEEG